MKTTKNEDNLKNEDILKNEDDLKNEDNLKNENDLKNEKDLKNWLSPPKIYLPPPPLYFQLITTKFYWGGDHNLFNFCKLTEGGGAEF